MKQSRPLVQALAEHGDQGTSGIGPQASLDDYMQTAQKPDYVDFDESSRINSPGITGMPGIKTSKLFRNNPNFLAILPLDVLSADSSLTEEFYSSTAKADLCIVLAKYCSSAL